MGKSKWVVVSGCVKCDSTLLFLLGLLIRNPHTHPITNQWCVLFPITIHVHLLIIIQYLTSPYLQDPEEISSVIDLAPSHISLFLPPFSHKLL